MSMLLTETSTSVLYGGLTFGAVDGSGVLWRLTKLDGWGSPDSTIQPVPKPRQRGAWAGDAYSQERYVTVTLFLRAPTPALLNQSLDALDSACDFATQPLTVNEAGFSRTINVRRKLGVQPNKISSTMAAPTFQVVATDPRKFGAAVVASTGLPSATGGLTVATGGLTVPSGGLTIPAQVTTGQIELFNPGNETGPVEIRFDGDVTGPQVTHAGTGLSVTFSTDLSLGVGAFLDVNMEAHTALEQGQASRTRYITSRGWFGFDPGWNTYAFAATSGTTGTMTVTAYPAWR